jgi:TonB family protein
MKKIAVVLAIALCYVNSASASVDPTLQQSLIVANRRADLSSDESVPFQLEVDFIAQLNVPTRGHLSLKWEKRDQWWRSVVLGDYQQIEVKDGEWHYTKRNADFTPVPVGNLINLLSFGAGSENLAAKREKRRAENGVVLNCIQTNRTDFPKDSPHEICLNGASNEIVVDEWQDVPDEKRREQFNDYFDFGTHRFPRRLELLVNGSKVIAANVVDLVVAPFDPSLLTPPQGAISRRECNGLKHAIPIKTPDPAYPKSASMSGIMGDSSVAMTVLTDGSVANIRLVGRALRSMDDATLETLKGWKFKPAMCGTEPVVTDITVIVSFRLTN